MTKIDKYKKALELAIETIRIAFERKPLLRETAIKKIKEILK